jgi:hypothetical protein
MGLMNKKPVEIWLIGVNLNLFALPWLSSSDMAKPRRSAQFQVRLALPQDRRQIRRLLQQWL